MRQIITSARAILPGIVLLDLAWRLPGALFDQLSAGASRAVVSVGGGYAIQWALLGTATTWVLFAVGLYRFAPKLYPRATDLPGHSRGFRSVFAVFALVTSMTIALVNGVVAFVIVILTAVLGAGGALLGYLHIRHGWRFTVPDERSIKLVDQFFPLEDAQSELEADLTRSGLLGVVGTALAIGAYLFVLGIPVFTAALAITILRWAYPLPDILVLAWASVGFVRISSHRDRSMLAVDLEGRLFGAVKDAARNTKGLALTLYVFCGIFISAGITTLIIPLASTYVDLIVLYSKIAFLPTWNLIGVLLLLIAAGLYGLWFWFRELRRVGTFVENWETESSVVTEVVARPPGLILPTIAASTASLVIFAGVSRSDLALIFAIVWPTVLTCVGYGVWVGRRTGPQATDGEDHVVIGSLTLQTVGLFPIANPTAVGRVLAGEGSILEVVEPVFLPLVWVIGFMGYVADISRYSQEHEDHRKYTLPAYLVINGILLSLSAALIDSEYSIIFLAIAAILITGGVGLSVTRYLGI